MKGNDACPVCDHVEAVVVGRSDHDNRTIYNCPRCGRFTIGGMAVRGLAREGGVVAKLPAWIRDHQESGRGPPVILQHNLEAILSSLLGHESVSDKQRLLFHAVGRRAATPEQAVRLVVEDDYPLAHAQSGDELTYLLRGLGEQDLVQLTETQEWVDCQITPKGWSHLEMSLAPDGGSHRTDDDLPTSPVGVDVVDVRQHRFDVALSFPGEYRPYVERVAAELGAALGANACFYDRNYRAQLAVPNMDALLQEIYGERSDLVVAFVCQEYEEKMWCGIEWRKIRERLSDGRAGAIMYVRIGSGDVAGMTALDGYVDASEETPDDVARLICERLHIVKSRGRSGSEQPGYHGSEDKRGSGWGVPEGPQTASQARLAASVEALLKSVDVCQEAFSGAMTALSLLTAGELDDVFHGRRVGSGVVEYMLEGYRDIRFVNRTTERIREPLTGTEELFVSECLWTLYGRVVQLHGRLAMLFHLSFERGSYLDWREDKPTLSMMSASLGDERLTVAKAQTIGGANEAAAWLGREFIKEARNLLRDPQSAYATARDSAR